MWRVPRADGPGPGLPYWNEERARFAPASLDWRVVLIDTPDVVCYLDDVRVYPASCRFNLHALLKPSAAARAVEAFAAGGRPGPEQAAAADFDEAFLLGVEYEDGGRSAVCVNINHRPQPFESEPDAPTLRLAGSSRSPGVAKAEVRLEGLPGKGSVTVHAQWTALGAPESMVELDGAALRSAAERAVELWPVSGFSSPAS